LGSEIEKYLYKSCKINVKALKAAENQKISVFILNFPAETTLPSKFYYTTDVVRVCLAQKIWQVLMKMENAKILSVVQTILTKLTKKLAFA
jgi:hypothetical protein